MIKTLEKAQPTEQAPSKVDRVGVFCSLIEMGIERWMEAGRLLSIYLSDDPDLFQKIRLRAPYMTNEILLAFKRIGEKKLYPYLLLDASPASKKLAVLSYNQQTELYGKPVKVAYQNTDGSFESYETPSQRLSSAEASLVFSPTGVRSVEEQIEILKQVPQKINKRTKPKVASTPSQTLIEDPKDEVLRRLNSLQQDLIDTRMALERLGKPIKNQYAWIDTTLQAIKELRSGLK